MFEDSVEDVFNYSVFTIARVSDAFAMRLELNGRFLRDFGEDFHDVSLWPGLDFNVSDRITIRPQGLVHLNDDAWEWGVGIGAFVDLDLDLDLF